MFLLLSSAFLLFFSYWDFLGLGLLVGFWLWKRLLLSSFTEPWSKQQAISLDLTYGLTTHSYQVAFHCRSHGSSPLMY